MEIIPPPFLMEYLHHFCLDFGFNFVPGEDGGDVGDIFRLYLVNDAPEFLRR